MISITIFTPSYNRAHLLPRVYESLCKLDLHDPPFVWKLEEAFEWLIVDDGSTDNTEEVVNGFIQEGKISIRYIRKTNGGKHTAINLGAKEAKGELFLILDSDDSLPKNAIADVAKNWMRLSDSQKKSYAGICGYMAHHDGTVIGTPIVEGGTVASSLDMRYKLHVVGDMMEVWRTDVMREFPFPEIPNERFCPEALVWNRIANKYPLYIIPDVIYYRDYLDGGLTDNIVKIRMKSPVASMMTYAELNGYDVPFVQKVKAAINYWRFRFCTSGKAVGIGAIWHLLAPVGWLMHLRERRLMK